MNLSDLKKDSYLSLPEIFYDKVSPSPLNNPFLVHFNKEFASEIGFVYTKDEHDQLVRFINGEDIKGLDPFAMVYAGHQFGHFVPRLGDGRAINLGVLNGYRLQTKGSGRTLYSRDGDGRAVLRSSIREYLVSEAMHSLGIETTRALAIIGSKHRVYREKWESGAIVLRASPTWIRFGSFEYFAYSGRIDELKLLIDFTIKDSFLHLLGEDDRYIKLFEEVVDKTALMVAKWMSVGFSHGVMNTDNFSIFGLSIDYGPFSFMDDYNPNFICNHTDREGRYSFSNQPQIAYWNLLALVEAFSKVIKRDSLLEIIKSFEDRFNSYNIDLVREKLGLEQKFEDDINLMKVLFSVMAQERVDFTLFFRTISSYNSDRSDIKKLFKTTCMIDDWLDLYDDRLKLEKCSHEQRVQKLKKINPKYILKNYMLQEAIDKAELGDFSGVDDLFRLAKDPFSEHPFFERYAKATPKEFSGMKLSCSS